MKSQKLLSLDLEVIESLQELPNASAFVNDMLKETFMTGHGKAIGELKKDILKQTETIASNVRQLEKLEAQLKALEKKEKKLSVIFEKLPERILEDLQDFPNMTQEILKKRWKDIYEPLKVSWENTLEAWETYHASKS